MKSLIKVNINLNFIVNEQYRYIHIKMILIIVSINFTKRVKIINLICNLCFVIRYISIFTYIDLSFKAAINLLSKEKDYISY
jgi:hypothetical protein